MGGNRNWKDKKKNLDRKTASGTSWDLQFMRVVVQTFTVGMQNGHFPPEIKVIWSGTFEMTLIHPSLLDSVDVGRILNGW